MVGLDNNTLAISWEDPVSFCIIYIERQKTTHILRRYTSLQTTRGGNYMADIDNDLRHVIQPCNVDKAVYSFNLGGDPIFIYKTEKLKEPKGVDVDLNGHVYI